MTDYAYIAIKPTINKDIGMPQLTGLDFYISRTKQEGYHYSESVYLHSKEVLKHQLIRAYCRISSNNEDINADLLKEAQEYYTRTYGK